MRLLVPIAITSLAILLQNPVPQKHAETAHPDQQAQKTTDYSEPGSQVVYVEASGTNENVDTTTKTATSQQASPSWWQRPTVTDWILSALTLCYLGVNVFMLLAIKRQAHLADKSVNALMSAEQAVFKMSHVEVISFSPTGSFRYWVTNIGKTPGTIFAHNGSFQVGDSDAKPSDVSVFDYRKEYEVPERIIEADTSEDAGCFIAEKGSMTSDEQGSIRAGTTFLWACGFFCYRDIFGRPFTQRYCYLWTTAGKFIPAGPWEYRRLI
jgi:hypothetical protein